MINDVALFKVKDVKDETITLRVSKSQKEKICQMAGGSGISAFVLWLIGQEYERQISESEHQICGNEIRNGSYDVYFDDDLPF